MSVLHMEFCIGIYVHYQWLTIIKLNLRELLLRVIIITLTLRDFTPSHYYKVNSGNVCGKSVCMICRYSLFYRLMYWKKIYSIPILIYELCFCFSEILLLSMSFHYNIIVVPDCFIYHNCVYVIHVIWACTRLTEVLFARMLTAYICGLASQGRSWLSCMGIPSRRSAHAVKRSKLTCFAYIVFLMEAPK